MEQGKAGVAVTNVMPRELQKPIEHLQLRFKDLENGFKDLENGFKLWLSKQSLPVEAAVVSTTGAAQGAAIGAFMATFSPDASSIPTPSPQASLNPQAMASLKQVQVNQTLGSLNLIINHGLFLGSLGTSSQLCCHDRSECWYFLCLEKNQRQGRRPVQHGSSFWFWSHFSLVSGMGGPNQAANAVTSGLFFALVQGGIFQFGKKFSKAPAEDIHYAKTRHMLDNLGLQNYEKNFKKGLLTDNTLPLLTDSALRDVRIPPGPRLLILDHIERDSDFRGSEEAAIEF